MLNNFAIFLFLSSDSVFDFVGYTHLYRFSAWMFFVFFFSP